MDAGHKIWAFKIEADLFGDVIAYKLTMMMAMRMVMLILKTLMMMMMMVMMMMTVWSQ